MNNLPIEIIFKIFKYLNFQDILSCKLVNKKLNCYFKQFRINEIAFTKGLDRFWFHCQPIDYEYLFDYRKTFLLRNLFDNLQHLKRLKLTAIGLKNEFNLNDLNKFTELQHLDIDLDSYKTKQINKLSLPNLKVLYIFLIYKFEINKTNVKYRIELDTPELEIINTFSLHFVKFNYPEKINSISTLFFYDDLTIFKNLEYFKITCTFNCYKVLDYYYVFHLFDIKQTPKLKEIEINLFRKVFALKHINICRRIVNDKIKLNRSNLKVYWLGIEITNVNLQKLSTYADKFALTLQLENFNQLYDKSSIDYINEPCYNRIYKFLIKNNKISSDDFFHRYSLISVLYVIKNVIDQDNLITFISNCKNLNQLRFDLLSSYGENNQPNQDDLNLKPIDNEFFDKLPIIDKLNTFILINDTKNEINFHFITNKFQNLEILKTNLNVQIDLIEKLDYLYKFKGKFNRNKFKITKSTNNKYNLIIKTSYLKIKLKNLNYNTLINNLKQFQDNKFLLTKFKSIFKL